jgi:anti-anti-sigma factor
METVKGLTLWNTHSDDRVVIFVRGELDFATSPALVQAIWESLEDAVDKYVINCQEVTFIDSEMLKNFLNLKRQFEHMGKVLVMSQCSPTIERILNLLGIKDQIVTSSAFD